MFIKFTSTHTHTKNGGNLCHFLRNVKWRSYAASSSWSWKQLLLLISFTFSCYDLYFITLHGNVCTKTFDMKISFCFSSSPSLESCTINFALEFSTDVFASIGFGIGIAASSKKGIPRQMFELKYAKAKACSGKQFWGKTQSCYNNPKWASTTYWPLPILLTKTLNPGDAKRRFNNFTFCHVIRWATLALGEVALCIHRFSTSSMFFSLEKHWEVFG